jgi:ribose-phosphate pyrophosphokinase
MLDSLDGFGIVSGGVYPELAAAVADILDKELVDIERKKFSNGERYVRFLESVRRRDLFVIQSFSETDGYSINDALMETLLIIDAAKRASSDWVTVVLPILPYARQDRKARNREPISVSVVIRMLSMVGVNRIVTIDLHSAQTQAIFDRPFDHLTAQPLIYETLRKIIGKNNDKYVMIAPDAGRVKESEQYADELGIELINMPKSRDRDDPSKTKRPAHVDGVKDMHCITVDDMIDTGGTLLGAINTLKASGAESITVGATHGIFSGDAIQKFKDSPVDKLIIVDTMPQDKIVKALGDRVQVLSIAPLIAESLIRIYKGESISVLFGDKNNK